MGKPAARITDFHTCPMVTPGTPPIPHVGGPVVGPGVPTVLIGGMVAAVMGDTCVCTGPPDTIVLGSTGVFIGGKPAARMGDLTAHGGVIVKGQPNVLIGEISPAPVTVVPKPLKHFMIAVAKLKSEARAAGAGPEIEEALGASVSIAQQQIALRKAAAEGTPFTELC